MADNLIDNAVRHNTAEGWIEIRTESAGGEARLEISNSGTVMTAEEAASLTEPFRRRGTARTGDGLGLGLSIAASVAQAHGGQLTLDPVQRGGAPRLGCAADRARERRPPDGHLPPSRAARSSGDPESARA